MHPQRDNVQPVVIGDTQLMIRGVVGSGDLCVVIGAHLEPHVPHTECAKHAGCTNGGCLSSQWIPTASLERRTKSPARCSRSGCKQDAALAEQPAQESSRLPAEIISGIGAHHHHLQALLLQRQMRPVTWSIVGITALVIWPFPLGATRGPAGCCGPPSSASRPEAALTPTWDT